MIRKYKLVACLPTPLLAKHPRLWKAHTYTETGSDPRLTADRHSALLYRDLNCNKQSTERLKKQLKYRGKYLGSDKNREDLSLVNV